MESFNFVAIGTIVGATIVILMAVNLFLAAESRMRNPGARKTLLALFCAGYMAILTILGTILVNHT